VKRKLIKQGKSALTVTLPSKWVEKLSLKAGDEVEVEEKKEDILISKKGEKKEEIKRIEIDVTNYDRSSFLKILTSLYEMGYDEINIIFDKDKFIDYKIDKTVRISHYTKEYIERLIGLEIVSHDRNQYLLKDVAIESEKEFDNMLRRIFLLLLEFQEMIVKSLENNDLSFIGDSFERHENIHKFASFCLRALNRKSFDNTIIKSNLFYLVSLLDRLSDITRYCCDDAKKIDKVDKKTIDVVKLLNELFRDSYDLYYSNNDEKTKEKTKKITRNRFEIKKKIDSLRKISHGELVLITRYSSLMEFIQGLIKIKFVHDSSIPKKM